ncbi:MAG: FHA domain-containing protein, partial [Planctomycetes bacterium]|nr:FHA domain-containing protein [Planctomycetota bacterium]
MDPAPRAVAAARADRRSARARLDAARPLPRRLARHGVHGGRARRRRRLRAAPVPWRGGTAPLRRAARRARRRAALLAVAPGGTAQDRVGDRVRRADTRGCAAATAASRGVSVTAPRLDLVWVDAQGERHATEVTRLTRIGRAPECEVVLDEEGVSRIHCELRQDGALLSIRDLHSTNGTYVNGARIESARLQDGDTILLGRILLRVESREAAPEAYKTCAIGPEAIELALDGATLAYPPDGLAGDAAARHLGALYGILQAIGEAADVGAVLESALATLLRTLPFDDGHVLLAPAARDAAPPPELRAVASRSRHGAPAPWSGTVVRRVLASGQAVLANDVQSEPELKGAKSLVAARSVRIACAPLEWRGRAGAIYLSARGLDAPIGAEEVAFLMATARQLGLAADALAEREHLARENEQLRRFAPTRQLIGDSEAMQRLRELVARAASVDATVLVAGESGTGKELVARGIHEQSARRDAPFVAVNCGALPASVVTSELFGHEKGAFTGANERRIGLVERAHGGTLFLDEVAELPAEVQVMLLRLLEERRFFRVGGSDEVRVDVRFVAATHRDLDALARAGKFRNDLLFRLKVVELRTPPLRERPGDIDRLAPWLLGELARASGRAA